MRIAIQGHPTRGKEIIQILENLGGKKLYHSNADDTRLVFFINDKGYITCLHCENPILKECYKIYTLTEFEKEFPFKVGDKVISVTTHFIGTITNLEKGGCYYIKYDNGNLTCAFGQNLKLYKEMKEERNITLTLDKAKEWYKNGGELREIALQAFTEQELSPLPKSWEEYCKRYKIPIMMLAVNIPDKYIALWKLEQLRDCYRQGWKPDWNDLIGIKYCIAIESDTLRVRTHTFLNTFLTFQSREITEEFLKYFKPLIKEAEDLI